MLNQKTLNKILFIDIETVPQYESCELLPLKMQKLFRERFKKEFEDINKLPEAELFGAIEALYAFKGSLFVEWAKIVCISCGVIDNSTEDFKLKTVSFTGHNDSDIIKEMMTKVKGINQYNNKPEDFAFCAHNGKIFDFPFIAKRMIINGLEIPKAFNISDKKPWDLLHLIDTKEMWKFGVYDNNSSLSLLAATFNVASSKDEMDGSMVKDVYYKEKDLPKIATYCEKDILALATVYLRMNGIQNQLTKI